MDKIDYIDVQDISDEIDTNKNSSDDEKFISIVDDIPKSDTSDEIESVVVIRTCKDCKKELVLNLDNYYAHGSCTGGFHTRCKACHNKKYLFVSPKNKSFLKNISLVDGNIEKIEKDILSLEKLLDKKKNNLEKVKNKPEKVSYTNYVVTIPNNYETEFLKFLDDTKLKYKKNKTAVHLKRKNNLI